MMKMAIERSSRRKRSFAILFAGACLSALAASSAAAQVERNLPPPVETHREGLLLGDQNLAGSTDETPLGANLSGVVLLGPKEDVSTTAKAGVAIGDIGPLDHGRLQAAIQPFVGRPLSRKLISDIEAAIARSYREAGYPFVSITIPPHDAGSGVLQLRVVEFHMGHVDVKGSNDNLQGEIRAERGGRIEARGLEEDLDWLNRNPYRQVQGVFSPDDEIGASRLTLDVTEDKPWQVFAGYSNTGTAQTGYSRYFIGGGAVLEGLNDTLVSYQLTGSSDFWSSPGNYGGGDDRPNYMSQSGRIVIPTFARQAIEITPSFVQSRANVSSIVQLDNNILEVPVTYRSAISNILPDVYLGDISAGVEFKHLSRSSYFAGTQVGSGGADLFQIALGWADQWTDSVGSNAFDLEVRDNPGSVLGGNTDAAWNLFSAGRVTSTNYAYVSLTADRSTTLGSGFAWNIHLSGLWADQALPDTEQLSMGGLYGARSFTLDDGVADRGLFVRNELRLPNVSLLDGAVAGGDDLSPFFYVDYGTGHQFHLAVPDTSLVGVGLGADYRLSNFLSANIAGGNALTDGVRTHSGDWNVQVHLALTY